MIPAMSASSVSRLDALGAAAVDPALEQETAQEGADFLLQLLAALDPVPSQPGDASEQEAHGLQILPTQPFPVEVVTAIFAAAVPSDGVAAVPDEDLLAGQPALTGIDPGIENAGHSGQRLTSALSGTDVSVPADLALAELAVASLMAENTSQKVATSAPQDPNVDALAPALAPQTQRTAAVVSATELTVRTPAAVAGESESVDAPTQPQDAMPDTPANAVTAKTGAASQESANPPVAAAQGQLGREGFSGFIQSEAPSFSGVMATLGNSLSTAGPPQTDAVHSQLLPPHQMRLDSGPVNVQVLQLVRQGGGQIVLELTPPDQGTYRLDLRLDAQGRAVLAVEGASDSVRTRLEQGESGLRDQLSQMGLSLELSYRQADRDSASQRSAAKDTVLDVDGSADNARTVDPASPRQRADAGLVHLYA